MKFVIDAQLPRQLAIRLNELGHEARHTLGLSKGNQTPDREISSLADRSSAVVITKDADFVDSHVLTSKPAKLLLVSTGNISNRNLLGLFEALGRHRVIGRTLQAHRGRRVSRQGA